MADVIQNGQVVNIHYTLTNEAGEVLDRSGEEPLAYLHGKGNIVPGLEAQLNGHAVGDKLSVDVLASAGYGEKVGPGPQAVPRSTFPKEALLKKGMPFHAEDSEGQTLVLWITDVRGSRVFVDVNHPLAGVDLHFEVEVVSLRDASQEELAHGHPHGPGGHHH